MITEEQYKEVAKDLGVEVAVIKAVAEVESRGSGFLPTGEPKILFEPHVFWKELLRVGINPKAVLSSKDGDILYQRWGTKPYGRESEQHSRLQRASNIHREAALKSASYGAFQIMGFNYEACGFDNIQDFINAMYKDDYSQLLAFVSFLKTNNLVRYLKNKNWEAFAKGYNGKSYKKNNYHIKLQKSYDKYKN